MVKKNKKTSVDEYNMHLMVDFTAMQLKLCYESLVMYPEIQKKIVKLISELSKV